MDVFAESVACRYSELYGENVPFPEDGYRGSYIYEIAKEISENYGNEFMELGFSDRKEKFKEVAYQMVLEHIKNVLIRMNVNFDIWFSERSLHLSGALEMAVKELESRGFVYEKDGALWFKSTAFGDEKDRVLVRSSGEPTYFLADIAYHINKKERGFDRVINIWGADHHGYVPRMMAAIRALGYEEDFLEIIIGQMVNLLSGGSPVRMSKRTGEMVTLEELLDEVGPDAIRFFFVSKSTDSTLDFDIELAKEQSQENPVYYVQYAHARICSILRKAEDDYGIRIEEDEPGGYIQLIGSKDEMRLISKLSVYPEIIDVSARTRDVHHLPAYLIDLASSFHSFYQKVRVITEDESLTRARLFLVKAVRDIMADGLDLLGVSAPEKM
jgi:arginyl-tRNA synthetase